MFNTFEHCATFIISNGKESIIFPVIFLWHLQYFSKLDCRIDRKSVGASTECCHKISLWCSGNNNNNLLDDHIKREFLSFSVLSTDLSVSFWIFFLCFSLACFWCGEQISEAIWVLNQHSTICRSRWLYLSSDLLLLKTQHCERVLCCFMIWCHWPSHSHQLDANLVCVSSF